MPERKCVSVVRNENLRNTEGRSLRISFIIVLVINNFNTDAFLCLFSRVLSLKVIYIKKEKYINKRWLGLKQAYILQNALQKHRK